MKAVLVFVLAILLSGCATTPEKKLARYGTAELKLRHSQLAESLGGDTGPDIEWLKPVFFRGPSRAGQTEEKQQIEFELSRRYRAGDAEAYLPIFKSADK